MAGGSIVADQAQYGLIRRIIGQMADALTQGGQYIPGPARAIQNRCHLRWCISVQRRKKQRSGLGAEMAWREQKVRP